MTTSLFTPTSLSHFPLCQVAFFLIQLRSWVGNTGLAGVERDPAMCFAVTSFILRAGLPSQAWLSRALLASTV